MDHPRHADAELQSAGTPTHSPREAEGGIEKRAIAQHDHGVLQYKEWPPRNTNQVGVPLCANGAPDVCFGTDMSVRACRCGASRLDRGTPPSGWSGTRAMGAEASAPQHVLGGPYLGHDHAA